MEIFFEQKFGMAMRNPLSPVLSNLCMKFYEKYILSEALPQRIYWRRYVATFSVCGPEEEILMNLCL